MIRVLPVLTVAALSLSFSACSGATLGTAPGTDPAPGVFPGSGTDASDGAVVEYFVQCRGCTIEFSTPEGLGREEDSDGLRRRFQFSSRVSRGVTLRAIPRENDYIVTAAISVDGRELARASRDGGETLTGEPVVLNAVF